MAQHTDSRECARGDCSKKFSPKRPWQKFCSASCRKFEHRHAGQAEWLDKLRAAREVERVKAIQALGRYKFWMFGYHAAGWVKLNRLLPKTHREGNPFAVLVAKAREML